MSATGPVIGRGTQADVKLIGPNISRRHLRIARNEGGYTLFDLGSSHRTFVNGHKTEKCQLRHGDRIRLAQDGIELVYLLEDQATTNLPALAAADLGKSLHDLASLLPDQKAGATDLEKLSCLLDLQFYWSKTFSPERTFHATLKSALEISGAERGYILLKRADGFQYQVGMNGSGSLLSESDFRTSSSVVDHVVNQEEPVFMTEKIGGQFAQQESIVAMNLRAIACLPLVAISKDSDSPEVLGILYLDSTKAMNVLSSLDRRIIQKLAEQAGNVLDKLEMVKAGEEQKQIQQDLIQAREIQRSILPQAVPVFETFSIHHFNHPTRHVGGDFYDFLTLESGELVGVVADVAGKGVPAALLSSLIQGALHMEFRSCGQTAEVLKRVNKMLCEKSPSSRFVTMFVFVLAPSGIGHYISAGHNTAYLYRAATKKIEELPSGGLILGAFPVVSYECSALQLAEGDVLVVYSDGLTDAEGPAGENFGEERLQELILKEAAAGSHALERKLLEAMENFTRGMAQTDDITFVIVERTPPEAKRDTAEPISSD